MQNQENIPSMCFWILCEVGEKVWWKIGVRFSQNQELFWSDKNDNFFFQSLFDSMKINEHHFKKLKCFERRRHYQSRYYNWNIKEFVKKRYMNKNWNVFRVFFEFWMILAPLSIFQKDYMNWMAFSVNQKMKSSKIG